MVVNLRSSRYVKGLVFCSMCYDSSTKMGKWYKKEGCLRNKRGGLMCPSGHSVRISPHKQ